MTLANLEAVEKLRETRERTALAELESGNRARDLAGAAAAHFEEQLHIQTDEVTAQQNQLYEEIVGRQVTEQALNSIRSRVETRNAELDVLAEQCSVAKDAAVTAAEDAERARIKHAGVYRAQQKWSALMKMEKEKVRRSEGHCEEQTIEDSIFHLRPAR